MGPKSSGPVTHTSYYSRQSLSSNFPVNVELKLMLLVTLFHKVT